MVPLTWISVCPSLPRVTIVIPVYGKALLTYNCLKSVHEQYLSALESRAGEPADTATAPRGGRRKAAAVKR